jgi:hypothetical protein
MRKSLFAPLLLLAPLLQGCIAVPAAIGGALVAQEVLDDNTYVGRISADAGKTWTTTKLALAKTSLKPIEVDDQKRKAVGEVDSATVTCTVETYDLNMSVLRVSAKKYGVGNGQIAKLVFDKILADLDTQ